MHLYHNASDLLEFLLIKVPHYTENSPCFYLDSQKSLSSHILSLLSPYATFTDISKDFENFACVTPLSLHDEGKRVYLEEQGVSNYDDDLQRSLIGYSSFVDPRSRYLGSRIIAVQGCVEADVERDPADYKIWRIVNGVYEVEKTGTKIRPFHLNFQFFNGKTEEVGNVFTACGMVPMENYEKQEFFVDKKYGKKLDMMRVLDGNGELAGMVYEYVNNFALVRMNSKVESGLVLENGDKIMIWKPYYMENIS